MRRKSGKRGNLTPVYQLIFELSELFDRECEVCLKKMRGPTPGFVFHHCEYPDGEKTHRDFTSRLKYHQYLKKTVFPKHIKLGDLHTVIGFLCNACHHSIDGPRGLKHRKPMNVLRLFLLYFRTNT